MYNIYAVKKYAKQLTGWKWLETEEDGRRTIRGSQPALHLLRKRP
jgi:hypothetical protein